MVRIFVASRRPCEADALATSSYEMYLVPHPLSDETLVSAAVVVVFPWSTWPMVPTFTCGLVRSNFALAMPFLYLRKESKTRKVTSASRPTSAVLRCSHNRAGACAPITQLQHTTTSFF